MTSSTPGPAEPTIWSSPSGARAPATVCLVPGWCFALVVLSWGVLAPVPLLVAAQRGARNALYGMAALYGVVVVALLALGAQTDRDADGDRVGALNDVVVAGHLVLLAVVIAHLVVLRRAGPVAVPTRRDPAVLAALAGRERRAEARALAAADPLLARELRVGRPDLPHRYDDGGLVDLVTAPAAVIAGVCGVSAGHAEEIVRARDAAGAALRDVEDLALWVTVPFGVWEQVRERGIVLGLPRA